MSFNNTWRSGILISVLAWGVGYSAAAEPVSTNDTSAVGSGAPAIAVMAPSNAVSTAETTTNQPVVQAATNEVPTPIPAIISSFEPAPSALEDGLEWMERIPVDVEEGDEWWRNRVEIGTRITSFELTDKQSPPDNNFLGSINTLKEDQDYTPTKLYANVWVLEWLGVGLSYEKMGAETWTEEPGYESYTDGTFELDGPILSLLAAWPNSTRFTPFVEVGQWMMSGSFKANSDWGNAHGIDGYQDLEVAKEKGGFVFGGGCAIQLTRHLEMDVLYRQITASVEVDHVLLGTVRASGREFPLDSSWLGLGIKYRF